MRSNHSGVVEASARHAALFVDYENLYHVMRERAPTDADVHDVILELIEDLCHTLAQSKGQLSAITAYADFSEVSDHSVDVQHELGRRGIEPRFISRTLQPHAVEVQLCVDALTTAFQTKMDTIIVVAGDRPYLPLIQQIEKHGRRAQVVLLERREEGGHLLALHDCIEDVSDLLSERERDPVQDTAHHTNLSGAHQRNGYVAVETSRTEQAYLTLTDPLCIEALELIDTYFGQYEEIYLTPLLRKLSEVLDEEDCDPKNLVSDLEDAGAVWLEKRRGSPHDYTVLIIDRNHPDIQRIRKERPAYQPDVEDLDYGYEHPLDGHPLES